MRRSIAIAFLMPLLLTACQQGTSVEEAKARCEKFAWDGERQTCYQQLALDECDADHCQLIENETLQASCGRAVERACD